MRSSWLKQGLFMQKANSLQMTQQHDTEIEEQHEEEQEEQEEEQGPILTWVAPPQKFPDVPAEPARQMSRFLALPLAYGTPFKKDLADAASLGARSSTGKRSAPLKL
eukprot:2639095-Amphidinium_carterae.1